MADGRDAPDATFACPDLTAVRAGTSSDLKSSGNDSSQIALSSRAESSIPTTRRAGVDEHVWRHTRRGRMIAAYREPDRARGRELMAQLIESLSQGVPAALTEVITLGTT
jgi:hypothetical protein